MEQKLPKHLAKRLAVIRQKVIRKAQANKMKKEKDDLMWDNLADMFGG